MESNTLKHKPRNASKKISVVIPAHNEESVITETLNAILAQDHPDFEIIVVDNASIDKTAEIVRSFISHVGPKATVWPRPQIFLVHEPKKGLLHARERGRKEARGEIIANMDADCLPETAWLKTAVKYFDDVDTDRTRIVAVSGPYNYHDAHPAFRFASKLLQGYVYRLFSVIFQHRFVGIGAVLIGGNNLIRADVLNKIGGYNTALLFYGEDTGRFSLELRS